MSDDVLGRAAEKLNELTYAAVTEMRSNATYWGDDLDDAAYRQGIANAVGGDAGDLAAALTPSFVLAVAGLLQILTGVEVREDGPLSDEYTYALKAARAVLGEVPACR